MGLSPSWDDADFAAGNARVGWNKAVRRCMRLRALLIRARAEVLDPVLIGEIDTALKGSFYGESDEFPPSGWDKET
jgi:hypothetical protein